MNLRDMHQRVVDLTRHNPKVPKAREEVYRQLNESHRTLLLSNEWTFMVRRCPLWMVPDFVGPAVLGAHPSTSLATSTALAPNSAWNARATSELEGDLELLTEAMLDGEVELETRGATVTGSQPWAHAPFRIERATVTVSSGAAWTLYLDPRFVPDATAATTTVTNIAIRFRRRGLPPDVMWPLAVSGPYGEIPIVGPAKAREFMTAGNRTAGSDIADLTGSRAECFIWDQGQQTRFDWPPSRLLATEQVNTTEESYAVRARRDHGGHHPPPIHQDYTATSNNSGTGTLTAGETYRVFVSWYVGGRFGPAGETQTVTLSSGHDSIALASLPHYESGHHANGRRLSVWMARGAHEAAFHLVGFVTDEQDPDVVVEHFPRDSDTIPSDSLSFFYANYLLRWDEEYSPRYAYLRPWPRPQTFERLEVDYLMRPAELIEPTDEPDAAWRVFHDAIVHHTTMTLADTYGARSMARAEAKKLKRRIQQMRARFLPPSPRSPDGIAGAVGMHRFPNGVDWQS